MTTRTRPGIKGRGSTGYLPGRFAVTTADAVDDGWHDADTEGDPSSSPQTELHEEVARSVITRNSSPDIPFEQSLNPYRGCEHGMQLLLRASVACLSRPVAGTGFRNEDLCQDECARGAAA